MVARRFIAVCGASLHASSDVGIEPNEAERGLTRRPMPGKLVPMKLKLDLHPLFDDGRRIEAALQDIIDQAVTKRASEVEIIPGKGSGALKKSVLRFLDRPEIKAKYHRIEKDGDNWGRLFVHFRWERLMEPKAVLKPREMVEAACFCCQASIAIAVDREGIEAEGRQSDLCDCPACGSPNHVTVTINRRGVRVEAVSGYEMTAGE